MKFPPCLLLGLGLSLLLHALVLRALGGAPGGALGGALGDGLSPHATQPSVSSVSAMLRLHGQSSSENAESTPNVAHPPAESAVRETKTQSPLKGMPRLQAYYFSATELDRKPHLLMDVNPVYPRQASTAEAVVIQLRLLISASGRVDHAIVEDIDAPVAFAEAAIDAFSDARFAPGMRAQQAVPSQMRLELRYTP